MPRPIIGRADDFWRLRLTRVDTTDGIDFEWHDDILYREPRVDHGADVERWSVEAIATEDFDTMVGVATFPNRDAAEAFLARAQEDLLQMTKSQFETAYLAGDDADAEPEPNDLPRDGW